MNCLLGISVTLIAIVAGMYLLAKSQRDNLGIIYKVIAYFVILTAFFTFLAGICCGFISMVHHIKDGSGCSPMAKHGMMQGGCMGKSEGCSMMGGGMHGMMEKRCEMKGMKCEKMDKACIMKCKMMSMTEEEETEQLEEEGSIKELKKEKETTVTGK